MLKGVRVRLLDICVWFQYRGLPLTPLVIPLRALYKTTIAMSHKVLPWPSIKVKSLHVASD